MIDLAAILLFLIALALIFAGGIRNLLPWLRAEWERMKADTWGPDAEPMPCSVGDPRVARMDLKRRALGKRLRRQGKTLLSGKKYVPVLTKPAEEPTPPKADRVVVPLRAVNR